MGPFDDATCTQLTQRIREWGRELGFSAVGISDTDLSHAEAGFTQWIQAGYHGEMDYMVKHGSKRTRPAELVPGAQRVISVRLPYWPAGTGRGQSHDWGASEHAKLAEPDRAVYRCMRVDAIIIRWCVSVCRSWPNASKLRSGHSVIAYLPIRRRCSKLNSGGKPASDGAASIHSCCSAMRDRSSSSENSMSIYRC